MTEEFILLSITRYCDLSSIQYFKDKSPVSRLKISNLLMQMVTEWGLALA